jgi:ABC-type glycerol-3-phosphate transport system substrate-binding protein
MSEIRTRLTVAFAIAALVTAACGTAATTAPIGAATPSPAAGESATAPPQGNAIAFEAASATIKVDGANTDWSAINGATVPLEQLRLAASISTTRKVLDL